MRIWPHLQRNISTQMKVTFLHEFFSCSETELEACGPNFVAFETNHSAALGNQSSHTFETEERNQLVIDSYFKRDGGPSSLRQWSIGSILDFGNDVACQKSKNKGDLALVISESEGDNASSSSTAAMVLVIGSLLILKGLQLQKAAHIFQGFLHTQHSQCARHEAQWIMDSWCAISRAKALDWISTQNERRDEYMHYAR